MDKVGVNAAFKITMSLLMALEPIPHFQDSSIAIRKQMIGTWEYQVLVNKSFANLQSHAREDAVFHTADPHIQKLIGRPAPRDAQIQIIS